MAECIQQVLAKGYGSSCRLRVWQQFTIYPQDMQESLVPVAECTTRYETPTAGKQQMTRQAHVFAFLVDLNYNRYPEDKDLPARQAEGYAIIYGLKPDPYWNRYMYLGRIMGTNTTQIGLPDTPILPEVFAAYSISMEEMTGAKDGVWAVPVESSSYNAAFAMFGAYVDDPDDICRHCWDYPQVDDPPNRYSADNYQREGLPTDGWKYDWDSYIHVMASSSVTVNELQNWVVEAPDMVEQILNEHMIPIPE